MKHLGKKTATILALLLIVSGVVTILELTNTTHLFGEPAASKDNEINYDPPTDAEKQDAETHKDSLPEKNEDTEEDNPGKKKATVEITTWAQKTTTLNVNGFVSNIIEEGGTCTLTLTNVEEQTIKVTQSRKAEPNANDTDCGAIDVPLSKLRSGTWEATLSYDSSTTSGESDIVELEVTR